MIRRTPLKRSTKPIARRSRVKAKRSQPRRGPLRDPGYRDFLRSECKCVACWKAIRELSGAGFTMPPHKISTPSLVIDPAHTENNGMRSKGPDSSCAPLCRFHHNEYDAGRATFEKKHGLNMRLEAAAHYNLYQIWQESTGVIE